MSAEVSKSFTDDSKNYLQVLFQRGRVVIDGELNEIGRLIRVAEYRKYVGNEHYIPFPGTERHSRLTAQNITIQTNETGVGVAPNDIRIFPNVGGRRTIIQAYGYVLELTAPPPDITTLPNTSGSNTFQQIYMLIEEICVSSGGDPNLKLNDLSETAVRQQLQVTFKVGLEDEDAALEEFTAEEPWEGSGKRTALLCTVHRAQGSGPTQAKDITERWSLPDEEVRYNDRFFNGQVRLRPSTQSPTSMGGVGSAAMSLETNNLTITNLCAMFGFSGMSLLPGNVGFLCVNVSGTFNFVPGDALVAYIPTEARVGPGPLLHEYEGVTGIPGPGQVKLEVIEAWRIGNQVDFSVDQNLDGRLVIALYSGHEENQTATSYTMDVVFADGKRITRKGTGRGQALEGVETIQWGHGNKFQDTLYMPDTVPNRISDNRPYTRTFKMAQKGSLKLIESHITRPEGDTTSISGDLAFYRKYTANKFQLLSGVDEVDFTGIIETVNARWDPLGGDPSNGVWNTDDESQASNIRYMGSNELVTFGNQAFNGTANRISSAGPIWTASGWINFEDTSGVHVLTSETGNLELTATNSSVSTISGWHHINFSNSTQPIRASGVTPNVSINAHFACTRPVAYGTITTDGNGNVTLDDASFNVGSADLVAISQATRCEITFTNPPDNSNYDMTAGLHFGDGISNPNISYNVLVNRISTAKFALIVRFEGAAFGEDAESLSTVPMTVSFQIFGGYNP